MADTIFVKAGPSVGSRVALWDVDTSHPGGEVYIAGQNSQAVEVAETARVLEALRDERIVRADRPAAAAPRGRGAAKSADPVASEPPPAPGVSGDGSTSDSDASQAQA